MIKNYLIKSEYIINPNCGTIENTHASSLLEWIHQVTAHLLHKFNYQNNYLYQDYPWAGILYLVRKYLDIIDYSMTYMYYVDTMQNIILKIPWFHAPASQFVRNVHYTMGKIANQKPAATKSFHVFCGNFSTIPHLKYWPNTISRKLSVKATYEVYLIYPKVMV